MQVLLGYSVWKVDIYQLPALPTSLRTSSPTSGGPLAPSGSLNPSLRVPWANDKSLTMHQRSIMLFCGFYFILFLKWRGSWGNGSLVWVVFSRGLCGWMKHVNKPFNTQNLIKSNLISFIIQIFGPTNVIGVMLTITSNAMNTIILHAHLKDLWKDLWILTWLCSNSKPKLKLVLDTLFNFGHARWRWVTLCLASDFKWFSSY